MIDGLTYLVWQVYYLQAPLKRDSWLKRKDGMDFNEVPPEAQDLNMDGPIAAAASLGWLVIFRFIAIGILVVLLIYIIVRLILKGRTKSVRGKKNVVEIAVTEEGPTALSPLDELWEAHKKAKKDKNYREAMRVLYQIVIKHLDAQGKLQAAADKTNREYTREMSWQEKAQDFFQLTLLHEFSWYGANEVNQLDFDRAEPRFLDFIESIKNG